MWSAILSVLAGPLAGAAIRAYQAKLAAGNTSERIAAELAARELDVQQQEARLQAEYRTALIGHWHEPANLFGYIMVIYFGKIIVWDKVLDLGTTDPILGNAAEWAGWIMMFYVGRRGFENVARILRK